MPVNPQTHTCPTQRTQDIGHKIGQFTPAANIGLHNLNQGPKTQGKRQDHQQRTRL